MKQFKVWFEIDGDEHTEVVTASNQWVAMDEVYANWSGLNPDVYDAKEI